MAISEPGIFLKTGGNGYDDDTEDTYRRVPPVDSVEVAEIDNPFSHEISRNLIFSEGQSETSAICVVKMVTAIPLVNPMMIG